MNRYCIHNTGLNLINMISMGLLVLCFVTTAKYLDIINTINKQ